MRNTKTCRLISTPMLALLALLFFGATTITAAPGDLDPTFGVGGKLIDGVLLANSRDDANGVAVQADGKIVVAGSAGDSGSLARYNPDGLLDNTFGSSGYISTCRAADVAIQVDGKIVIGCSVNFPTADFAIVRYNPDGSLDTSFGIGGGVTTSMSTGNDLLKSIAIQSDGKIVAAGSTDTMNTFKWWTDLFAVARYNADGSLDTTFDGDGKVITLIGPYSLPSYPGNGVAIQSDGKIIVVGSVYMGAANGHPVDGYGRVLIRYNVNGSLDTSFNSDGIVTTPCAVYNCGDYTSSVAIQADGKIVTAGARGGFNLARYNIDGSPDSTFGGGGSVVTPIGTTSTYAEAHSLVIQSDGKIVAAGKSYASTTGLVDTDLAVVRYNSNGSLDTTFDGDGIVTTPVNQGVSQINAIALQSDGRLIGVGFTPPNQSGGSSSDGDDFIVARYNPNGSLDTTFDTDGIVITDFSYLSGSLDDVVVQADGKIVAVAGAPYYAGPSGIARYNPDGTRDTTFGGGTGMANFGGSAVALQTDGKILTAGSYSCGDIGETVGTLARVNQDGSLDTSFDGDGIVELGSGSCDSWFSSLAIQPDGKIVAAGSVVARYNSDGSLDTTFGGGDGIVTPLVVGAVAIQADGKIVLARAHTGSSDDIPVARLNPDGSLDPSFDGDGFVTTSITSGDDFANSVAIQPDGKIVAAGTSFNGSNNDFAVVRYNANGSLDTTFNSNGIVTTPVGPGYDAASSVAIESDGKLVAAGSSNEDFALVRYNTNGSLDATFGGGDGKTTIDFSYSDDQANGMALDGQGRAVVVGTSDGRFAIGRFLGDQTLTCPNAIDCAEFFVRQHYQDFLNRAPDAGGLAYWTARITECGSDARCIHERRIGVSAAFFIEQEFQDTGYFVYRFYKASFGRQPNYTEFSTDRAEVIGGANLDASKQAFADEWVQRSAFLAAYPITLSNTEVVNKLFDSASLTASRYDPQRQQEILAMNAGRSRALVLRDLIEIADFKNIPDTDDPRYSELKQISQYNPAFVLMQYFGYLSRDRDQAGYDFWLEVLNNREPNNYRGMVCSFITSTEYQLRFGSMATHSNAECGP